MPDKQLQDVVARLLALGFEQSEIEWFTGPWVDYPDDRLDQIKPKTNQSTRNNS